MILFEGEIEWKDNVISGWLSFNNPEEQAAAGKDGDSDCVC